MRQKAVIVAALGECVHVAGVTDFLRLAEVAGWRTIFLGLAVPVNEVIAAAKSEKAALVGISQKAEKCSGKAGTWGTLRDSRELSTLARRSIAFCDTDKT